MGIQQTSAENEKWFAYLTLKLSPFCPEKCPVPLRNLSRVLLLSALSGCDTNASYPFCEFWNLVMCPNLTRNLGNLATKIRPPSLLLARYLRSVGFIRQVGGWAGEQNEPELKEHIGVALSTKWASNKPVLKMKNDLHIWRWSSALSALRNALYPWEIFPVCYSYLLYRGVTPTLLIHFVSSEISICVLI